MTSDPRAVPLLVGLGVDAMSVSPRMFLRVKQAVRGLRHEAMKKLVAKAITCAESDEIRRLVGAESLSEPSRASATSPSSRTSTTASPRWPTGSSR